jgi:hypothetical protein
VAPKPLQGLLALLLTAACVSDPVLIPTIVPTPTTVLPPTTTSTFAVTSTVTLPAPVEHRIGVRMAGDEGEFFDRGTGETFVPRGVNLIRLAGGRHSTLDVGQYDPDRIEEAFTAITAAGYNVVRVFLDSGRKGLPGATEALSSEYLDNTVDLLTRAKAHGLQILLTQDWLPESPAWSFSSDPMIEDVNSMYLSRGGLEKNRRFFHEWVQGLIERGAAFDALLAYELRNELYFTELYPPFSLSEGTVATANGSTYDLAEPDAKRRLLEENLVFWADSMREEILALDPTALVTVGFFQPKGPNTSRVGDDRLIETREIIVNSTMDFIDLHGYPGGELNLREIVENYGLPPVTEKPILLGEFGAEHSAYPTSEQAVGALVGWQVESCVYGFDGWLLWTWDSLEQPEIWNAMDDDAAISQALSPVTRPDPCAAGLGGTVELATGASVRVSTEMSDSPGSYAVDGLANTAWNSGQPPHQWIEVDLGEAHTVESIRLLVAQDPSGSTRHVISVKGESGDYQEIATLTGDTAENEWLEVPLSGPLEGIRFIGVETFESPSWVAWREISVVGS